MAKYIVINGIKIDKDYQNFVPETYGRLTTIGPAIIIPDVTGKRRAHQVCQCSCSARPFLVTTTRQLKTGGIQSCGCLQRELATIKQTTHGKSKTKEYAIWRGMRERCNTTTHFAYKRYGGRGISVCPQWDHPQGFQQFIADMGRRPPECVSIDRINNDGNYEPGNCRWATRKEQQRNTNYNRMLTAFGTTKCLAEWLEEYPMPYNTLYNRLERGWTGEKALTQPRKVSRSKAKEKQ